MYVPIEHNGLFKNFMNEWIYVNDKLYNGLLKVRVDWITRGSKIVTQGPRRPQSSSTSKRQQEYQLKSKLF